MIKAVLTGHSRGLGAAIAAALLARGIPVLALARGRCDDLGGRYPDLLAQHAIDLSDTAALAAWIDGGALAAFLADGESVLLINNAGLLQPVGPTGDLGAAAVASAVAVNVAAPLMLADAFVAASRHTADRRILHISSGAARHPYAGWSIYCATKAALDHHARCVDGEQLPNLRICSLAPGVIDTDMQADIRATPAERFPQRERFVALQRQGQLSRPQDAARSIVAHLLDERFGQPVTADLRDLE